MTKIQDPDHLASGVFQPANNFDTVRLALAVLVYIGHYVWLSPQTTVDGRLLFLLIGENGQRCVQAFFVISGFLMFQSFSRSGSIWRFYERRIRRIFPGYVVVILLSAFGGLWLSRFPLTDYLSAELMKYIAWNMVLLNFMHPTLPGVFDAQAIQHVNGALWTLKIEVAYYLIFPFLFRAGRRIGFFPFFCALFLLSEMYFAYLHHLGQQNEQPIFSILAAQLPGQLRFFMVGALAAAWLSEGTPKAVAGTVGATLLATAALVYPGPQIALTLLFAGAVLALCLTPPFIASLSRFGDLSYGIYIIHFPVLQTARATDFLATSPILRFGVMTTIVFALSVVLWRFVEQPALSRARVSSNRLSRAQEPLSRCCSTAPVVRHFPTFSDVIKSPTRRMINSDDAVSGDPNISQSEELFNRRLAFKSQSGE